MAACFVTTYRNSFQGSKADDDDLIREMKEKAELRRKRRQTDYYERESFVIQKGNIKDNMVYRSAYQRYFRQPRWDESSVEEFQQKLQYRVDRRSIEHQHQAWLWDSDDEEDEDVEEIPMDQKVNRTKQDEITQTEAQNENERRKTVQAWVKDQQDLKDVEKRKEELEPAVRNRKDPEHVNGDRSRIIDGNQADEQPRERNRNKRHHDPERRRHRSPEKKKEIPKERGSASPSRVQNFEEKRYQRPFLAYGWANQGPTEYKKTHNVLASEREVYPAALRAAKRRQNVIKEKVRVHEEAIRRKELIAPLEVEEEAKLFPRDMWITEYQRNFCKKDDIKRHFER